MRYYECSKRMHPLKISIVSYGRQRIFPKLNNTKFVVVSTEYLFCRIPRSTIKYYDFVISAIVFYLHHEVLECQSNLAERRQFDQPGTILIIFEVVRIIRGRKGTCVTVKRYGTESCWREFMIAYWALGWFILSFSCI